MGKYQNLKKRFVEMKTMNRLSNLNRELKQSWHVLLRESLQIKLRFLPQEMLGAQDPVTAFGIGQTLHGNQNDNSS